MEEKVDSSTAPDGSCLVSAQETEKWMEEAMRMVRKPAGGRGGCKLSPGHTLTRVVEQMWLARFLITFAYRLSKYLNQQLVLFSGNFL